MNRFLKKLRTLFRRNQLERDVEDELRFHLEMKAEEAGDPLEARRSFGNTTALAERCRELWMFTRLDSWRQDVRYAVRMLTRTPGFTAVAIAALALGIGADTAVFTIASGALFWNLGLDHLDRIVLVAATDRAHGQDIGVSWPDFRDLRSQTRSLAGLAAYRFAAVNVSDGAALPERFYSVEMSANGFDVSEQRPAFGRAFVAADERPGAAAVVILSWSVWQDRYGKDAAILGRTIRVNDVPRTVVGVMPSGRRFPEETDMWTPLVPDRAAGDRANRSLVVFGRLADGVNLATARAELAAIAGRLAGAYPAADKGLTASVRPIAEITGVWNMRPVFVALWVAVGFVLLIACADVANMLLARGAARMREISIRVAIGAGRGRIVRQLLVENVLLSIAGGFCGWLVALGGLRWFDAGTGVIAKPVWLNLSLDRTAFAYLAAVSIGAGILFGLAPALRLARIQIHTSVKDGGHSVAGGRGALSVSSLLVALQTALCIVLLAGAGLMIRSAANMYGAPVGVDARNVLTMHINLPEAKYPRAGDRVLFQHLLNARLAAIAGVDSAGVVSNLPLGRWIPVAYEVDGAHNEPGRIPQAGAIVASPGYFRVMRVHARRGREFTDLDGADGVPVILVNESFAKKVWPGQDPLGKRLRLADNSDAARPWLTVAGVLPDILQDFRRPLEHDPLIYLPFAAQPEREVFIVARTHLLPGSLAEPFRRTVQNMDANLPLYDVRTLENRLAETRLSRTLLGGMFSVFAAIALVLACIGLYAVVAHAIGRRTQEIGIRMALGGTRRDIRRLVYVRGMRPLALGMALGLPAAYGASHVLRMVLIGVSPGDPIVFTAVVLTLLLTGVVACAVPARRAMRVDPVVALRYE